MVRVADVNELHMDVLGDGVPALFVHGSFGWGLETFPEQCALDDQYQCLVSHEAAAHILTLGPLRAA